MQHRGGPVREAEEDILVGFWEKKSKYKSVFGDDKIALVGLHIIILMQKALCEL